jgi:hypothetical protein
MNQLTAQTVLTCTELLCAELVFGVTDQLCGTWLAVAAGLLSLVASHSIIRK